MLLASFELFGPGHLFSLSIIAAITVIIVRLCKISPDSVLTRLALGLLTFYCFAAYAVNQIVWQTQARDVSLDAIVPFHLCDIAAFICGFALLTRHDRFCEIAYFWGLAGTLQGLLTPNLGYDFPHPIHLAFFMHHGVIVITAVILPLGLGWRPQEGAIKRVFLWLIAYVIFAITANSLMNTNYGYLAAKPSDPSLLDIMPSWPWYIIVLFCTAALIFGLLNLPFRTKQRN